MQALILFKTILLCHPFYCYFFHQWHIYTEEYVLLLFLTLHRHGFIFQSSVSSSSSNVAAQLWKLQHTLMGGHVFMKHKQFNSHAGNNFVIFLQSEECPCCSLSVKIIRMRNLRKADLCEYQSFLAVPSSSVLKAENISKHCNLYLCMKCHHGFKYWCIFEFGLFLG